MEKPKANALRALLNQLAETEIKIYIFPTYNGQEVENLETIQNHINDLYQYFENELRLNLENRLPTLEPLLVNATKWLAEIRDQVLNFQKTKLKDEQKRNAESFSMDQLRKISNLIDFQLEIINKTEKHLLEKLEFVRDPELFTSAMDDSDSAGSPLIKTKIRANLSRVDLAILLWWLAEAELLELDKNHNAFVKFVEDNFQYFDKSKKIYADMKHIGSLMTKLNDEKSSETNPSNSQKELLKILKKIELPPEKSVLTKNKWNKA
jgi:hypothetical protein